MYTEFLASLLESVSSLPFIVEFECVELHANNKLGVWSLIALPSLPLQHGYIEEERVAAAFDRLDSDDSGYISRENLREILGEDCKEEELDEIIKSVDTNSDGKISYQEFLDSFRSNAFAKALELEDPEDSVSEGGDLLGLDAKIPVRNLHPNRLCTIVIES